MGKLSRSKVQATKTKKNCQLSLEMFFTKPVQNVKDGEIAVKTEVKSQKELASPSEKLVQQLSSSEKIKAVSSKKNSAEVKHDAMHPQGTQDDWNSQLLVIPNTPGTGDTKEDSTPKNSQGSSLYPTHVVPETPETQMTSSRFLARRFQDNHRPQENDQASLLEKLSPECVAFNTDPKKGKSKSLQEDKEILVESIVDLGKENEYLDNMKPLMSNAISTSVNKKSNNGRGMKLSRSYKKAVRTNKTESPKLPDDTVPVLLKPVQNISYHSVTKQLFEGEKDILNSNLSDDDFLNTGLAEIYQKTSQKKVQCRQSVNNRLIEGEKDKLHSNLSDDDFLSTGLAEIYQKTSQRKVQCSRGRVIKRKHGQNKPDLSVKEADSSIKPFRLSLKRSSTRGMSPNEKRKPSSNLRNPFAKNGVSGTCMRTLFPLKDSKDVTSFKEIDNYSVKEDKKNYVGGSFIARKRNLHEFNSSHVEDSKADDVKVLSILKDMIENDINDANDVCGSKGSAASEVRLTDIKMNSCSVNQQRQFGLKTPIKVGGAVQDVVSPTTKEFLEVMDNSWLEVDEACMMSEESDECTRLQKSFSALSPFKTDSTRPIERPEYPDLNRYVILHVVDQQFEKLVHVRSKLDDKLKVCILKGTWYQTPLQEGMVVAIHGTFDKSNKIIVNQNENFIVIKPDILLTGTAVAGSIKCKRRSVLRERFKGADFSNKAMLCGTILHEVFEQAISKKTFTKEFLDKTAKEVLQMPAFMNDMFRIGLSDHDVFEVVNEYTGPITTWAKKYYNNTPKTSASLDVKFPNEMKPSKSFMCVSDVKDIEENVCSPRWGIKGKVDLTVEVKIHREKPHKTQQTLILPLELKTGREENTMEHRSQLLLYSFLLSELGCSRELGFLLYLKTGYMISVPATHMDKRELINLRNHLAYYITQTPNKGENEEAWTLPDLPEPIQDKFACTRCSELHQCALLHRLEANPVVLNENIADSYQEKLEHLNSDELQYFRDWFLMCMLEQASAEERKIHSEMWKVDAWKREQRNQCYSGMLLTDCRPSERSGQYLLTFKRKPHHPSYKPLTNVQMAAGQRLAVTKEKTKEVALCVGFISKVTEDTLTIETDKELKKRGKEAVYRLDKDDSYNSMASSLVNLANLMKNEPKSSHIRHLIINSEIPRFEDAPTSLPVNVQVKVNEILADLNADQRCVIEKVLRSKDYTLVVGMPGTGKTTTIVALVRVLMYYNLSVLLTSYTHSAIDNILLKLSQYNVEFIRLGRLLSIHPDIRRFSEEMVAKKNKNISGVSHIYNTVPIVATTCLGSKHAIFSQRHFDVCIVDEASQISQPVCLGPLLLADRFVLVGDHHQLPPLVQSKQAKILGMDVSLFERLATTHPSALVSLMLQYRMNLDIMKLSNILVYDGALQCGSDEVARSQLTLPNWNSFKNMYKKDIQLEWLLKMIDPTTTVQFLNIDVVANEEQSSKSTNQEEAHVVIKLAEGLLKCGCKGLEIGVMSPYKNQCLLLESMLLSLVNNASKVDSTTSDATKIEVNTVDKYQGRDKEVIIVSFVKISAQGELLHDIRRLNVALTRAKRKLLLIGSYKALNCYDPLRNILAYLKEDELITNYPTVR